jgi:hypothetical protein
LNWIIYFPIFEEARRIRAPFAPPRLSDPRKVDAEAQAVDTNCDTDSPASSIFFLVLLCQHYLLFMLQQE